MSSTYHDLEEIDDALVPAEVAPTASKSFSLPEKIGSGTRHDVIRRLLRSLKARGISFEAATAACEIENRDRCDPPLAKKDLEYKRWWDEPDRPDFQKRKAEAVDPTASHRDDTIEDLQTFLSRMESQPELSWHIPGLIPDEGTCLWHGQPRDFKSMCAQEVALALAAGRPAFGIARFATRRPVKVAYFTEEDPQRLFAARMKWLTVKNPLPAPEFFFPFIRKSLSFDVESDRAVMLAAIRTLGVEVVVFDPMRSYTGLSDKGPADLRPVALFLRQIQNETLAKTLLLVHHDTKPSTAQDGDGRSRSQQASGGGIFSISDCPVSFTKLSWNQVAVFPEDYKLSGNPKPFEVTFETDVRDGDDGPRFGSWVRPIAVTKDEQDIVDGAAGTKILNFLRATIGAWHSTTEVNKGAKLRKDTAGPVLKQLLDEGLVLFCTGDEAREQGRNVNAKLWSGMAIQEQQPPPHRDEELF